jgi:hypothetical protein
MEVVVSFAPIATGPVAGRPQLELGISADNTQGKKVRLPILGEGGVACVIFQPSALDFGPVPEGMSSTRNVLAFNRCKDEVVLSELSLKLGAGGFFTLPQGPSGVPLAGGAKVPLQVTFTPKAGSGESSAELHGTVLQGRTTATAVLPITGRGRVFDPCQYTLSPTPLAFGTVQVGSEVTLAVSLTNVGPTDCFVSGMQLAAGSDLSFGAQPFEGTLVAPGARALLPVSFRPMEQASYVGLVEAWVNHPTQGHPTVSVSGEGVDSCFTVEPGTVDFGVAKLECGERSRDVMVFNRCTGPVTITSVALEDATTQQLALSQAPALPFTLAPGTQQALRLTYTPTSEGQEAATLRVTADGVGTRTVGLLGQGLSKPTQTDRFVQEAQSRVDVLFVVDNSGSMMEEQTSLGQNFAAFLSSAQQQGVDYHIGVTTTGIEASPGGWSVCPGGAEGGEAGRLFPVDGSTPRIITPATANAAGVFATNVKVGWCHWNEQGLESAYRALATPLVNSADDPRTVLANDGNGGFLRDDARLVLIFVTDEEDFSPQSVAYYETFFRGLKGNDSSLLSISAISGPENLATCPTASSTGSRYLALARATGGVTESICTPNWAASLQKLSDSAFGPKRRFTLSQTPADAAQLGVLVNGVPVGSGWTYDAASNSVVFDVGSVPPPGALIEVTYPLGC